MKKIKYIEIDGQEVALSVSKDRKNFRVVKPWKNKDGTTNWFNVLTGGSWWNLLLVAFMVIVITLAIKEYVGNINTLLDCFRVPGQLEICKDVFTPENLKIIPQIYG